MTLSPLVLALLGVVAALWLIAGVWAVAWGLRRGLAARAAESEAARLAALLRTGPALLLELASDGRCTADLRLYDRLGIERFPRFLTDLPPDTFEEGEASALLALAQAALRGAPPEARTMHVAGSSRVLLVEARAAPNGGASLWWFDLTERARAEERLAREVERLSQTLDAVAALIEAAPFPMWYRGPDLKLALVNQAYVRAVEAADAEDAIARGLELVEGSAGKGPLSAAAAARESGQIAERTAPATIAGQRRTVRIVDVPLGPTGVAGYAVDVGDLEEARGDLVRFARAQRDAYDRLSAGVALFGADRGLAFYNQPFLRLFALQPDWLADRPEFDRVLDRLRETGRAPESRDFPRWKAERRQWFTAEAVAEEAWLLPGGRHIRVVPQPTPDGGLLLIFEDRTEQVQLASARDTLLQVRNATFDSLFEAVGVFAADGRLNLWNRRFRDVWGLSEAELATHPRVDALVDAIGARLATPSRAGLLRELVRIATVERQARSGRVSLADGRHFEFAAVPLPDGNALFTMLDITAGRQIEEALRGRTEALEQADRLKTAFVANMSYELRVPLTSIGGFAEMLAGGYAGDLSETAGDYVQAILLSVTRLSGLIDDVLDLTQSDAGTLALAEEAVDLAAVARAAADEAAARAKERRLDFVVDVDGSVGVSRGDERRLKQAIDHLLRNAVGYTQPGGRVLFRARGDEREIEIVVSDNGPGIPEAERARVFDRFHRGSSAPGEGRAAAGLGLPLARRFAEAHGGTVELISEVGEGTAVILRLPRRA
ncbi:sensor histidine kinase [Sphingomonas jatrophae]|uniref:histidine kinase n=1 Tax=Sphingomonas jatrophae TaxID=1166337 RepID=A0A1I6KZG6_9SPHN|nr:PAS domain-containing sensor histidine kinase [Sphingomonas jatrophae]SFR96320.1 PAS/PAC sensor signal transduction histidine kinase [Sphingomonas jatrophae]